MGLKRKAKRKPSPSAMLVTTATPPQTRVCKRKTRASTRIPTSPQTRSWSPQAAPLDVAVEPRSRRSRAAPSRPGGPGRSPPPIFPGKTCHGRGDWSIFFGGLILAAGWGRKNMGLVILAVGWGRKKGGTCRLAVGWKGAIAELGVSKTMRQKELKRRSRQEIYEDLVA